MDEIIDINTMFGPMPAAASDLSVEELGGMMQKHGVRACFTLSTVGMLLDHTVGNAATRAAAGENHALIPVATMNPQTWFGGEAPFNSFAADGFKMVRFFPAGQGWQPDYAPFITIARHFETQHLPIMVQIDRPGVATWLMHALEGHPAHIVLAGVDESTAAEAVALMHHHPTLFVESSNLLASGLLKRVVEAVGSHRVLYGSGAPSRPMASGIKLVQHSGLDDADRARVLGANARELFQL